MVTKEICEKYNNPFWVLSNIHSIQFLTCLKFLPIYLLNHHQDLSYQHNFGIFNNLTSIFTRFRTESSLHTRCFIGFLNLHWHMKLGNFLFTLHFLLSNLNLHLQTICFIHVSSFIIVIILNTFKFISTVLFRIHTYFVRESIVLLLWLHLPRIMINE